MDKQISLSQCAFVEFCLAAGENYYLNIRSCVLYLPRRPADDSSLIISKVSPESLKCGPVERVSDKTNTQADSRRK